MNLRTWKEDFLWWYKVNLKGLMCILKSPMDLPNVSTMDDPSSTASSSSSLVSLSLGSRWHWIQDMQESRTNYWVNTWKICWLIIKGKVGLTFKGRTDFSSIQVSNLDGVSTVCIELSEALWKTLEKSKRKDICFQSKVWDSEI